MRRIGKKLRQFGKWGKYWFNCWNSRATNTWLYIFYREKNWLWSRCYSGKKVTNL